MNFGTIMFFSMLLTVSCQKDSTEYQPELQPYVKEIQNRVRFIHPSILQQADLLITEHWQKTAILSWYFCKLDSQYFDPLRMFLEEHPETINRVLEQGIRIEPRINLLIFKYFVIHNLSDVHNLIMEYFDVKILPEDEVITEEERIKRIYGQYYGNMEIWIEFYLDGT